MAQTLSFMQHLHKITSSLKFGSMVGEVSKKGQALYKTVLKKGPDVVNYMYVVDLKSGKPVRKISEKIEKLKKGVFSIDRKIYEPDEIGCLKFHKSFRGLYKYVGGIRLPLDTQVNIPTNTTGKFGKVCSRDTTYYYYDHKNWGYTRIFGRDGTGNYGCTEKIGEETRQFSGAQMDMGVYPPDSGRYYCLPWSI